MSACASSSVQTCPDSADVGVAVAVGEGDGESPEEPSPDGDGSRSPADDGEPESPGSHVVTADPDEDPVSPPTAQAGDDQSHPQTERHTAAAASRPPRRATRVRKRPCHIDHERPQPTASLAISPPRASVRTRVRPCRSCRCATVALDHTSPPIRQHATDGQPHPPAQWSQPPSRRSATASPAPA